MRVIRCGACMNNCPVYRSVGGHAYGWVYPGPIGAALDPHMIGLETARHLPNASTFCGKCEEVCPMRIPLPAIMRHCREQAHEQQDRKSVVRGRSVSVGVDAGGRRVIKKKTTQTDSQDQQ